MHRFGLAAVLTLVSTAMFAPPPQGGDLARRVAAAPDGIVKMTYASRDGICGDGRTFIAEGPNPTRGFDVWFMEGMSMSDYILREVGKSLERPMRAEVLERLRSRPTRRLKRSAAEVIRAERDAR